MPRGMHPNSRKALEENRHKGMFHGEKSVEMTQKAIATKARQRTFREEFQLELSTMIKDKNGNEMTVRSAITKAMVQKALKGDLRAAEYVRDSAGEKPTDTLMILDPDFGELDSLDFAE